VAEDLGTVVDLHHHWLPPELIDTVEQHVPEPYYVKRDEQGVIRIYNHQHIQVQTYEPDAYTSVGARLELLDAAGIDIAYLSPSCFPSWIRLDTARLINDVAADLNREYGDRLRPMVHVPPWGEPGILEEMERGARLGLHGVAIACSYKGLYPDEDVYLPFLKMAAELNLPVFVHAAGAPVHDEDMARLGLSRTLGRSLDHCLVTVRMLYSGVLAGIPNLRMVMPHLGGAFFINVKRFFHSPTDLIQEMREVPYEKLLDRMLFDTAPSFWYGPEEIECAVKNLGAHRIALGSDYPAGWDSSVLPKAVEHIRNLPFPAEDKRKIAGENALAFFAD
jgi:predicted TIM-barrel fold metal-dependent hydrolase